MGYVLEMKGICKNFAGVRALAEAHLAVKSGEAHALLGINGAGKSTMIKVLSGVYTKDSGDIYIDGELAQISNTQDAIHYGISAVYQDPQMIESYTGYENIYLGHEGARTLLLSGVGRRKLRQMARELVQKYPFDIDVVKPVYLMSSVEREIIAILRALSKECRILILDEPTSILTEKEKHILFEFIRTLKRNGVCVIYITHHLDKVAQVCESFSVFRNGRNVCCEEIVNGKVDSGHIAELMLGERLEQLYPDRAERFSDDVAMQTQRLTLEGKFRDITLTARKGEVLGVFGLVGSGIDELSKVLFGAMAYSGGQLFKGGRELRLTSPKQAIRSGIFLIPGNRKTEGFLNNISIAFNVTIAKIEKIVKRLWIASPSSCRRRPSTASMCTRWRKTSKPSPRRESNPSACFRPRSSSPASSPPSAG